MPETVFRFKVIVVKLVVVRNMAIVAIGPFAMAAVTPCSVLRCHDVAVYTGFGFVAEVRVCFRKLKCISTQAGKNAQ